LGLGTLVGLELQESGTVTQMWRGMGYITGIHPSTAMDGIVSYSYDFQGTGDLSPATT